MERPIWCHHDHDEELGQFFYGDPPPQFPNAPKAANLTASAPAQKPQDKPRLVAKRSPAEPPKERAVTRQPANAGRQQSNSRPPAESTSANFRRPCDEAYWDEAGNLLLDYFELQAGTRYDETLVDGFIAWLRVSPARFRRYVEGDDMARAHLVDWYLRIVR